MADLAETSTGSCLPSMRQGSQRTASPIEEIAKLAAKAKFDAFFVGSVFRKVTYPIGHRHFAKNPNPTKKARIWARRSFAIPSICLNASSMANVSLGRDNLSSEKLYTQTT